MEEEKKTETPFEKLYSDFADKAYSIAWRMTGDVEAAQDIVQEAFLQAYRSIESFRGESAITTWFYAILKNVCFRHNKRTRRTTFTSIEKIIDKVGAKPSPNDFTELEKRSYITQVKDGCLLGLMRCLSFYPRVSFILNVLFDLPAEKVASVIGKSPNAVRILVHRARRKIRRFLCKNCSLFDPANHCRCENFISFSLKQGWIEKYDPAVPPTAIEAEIRAFKDEVALMKTLTLNKVDFEIAPYLLSTEKSHR
jgi:RNA polymerase sigma factor (sigma-70 family)